MILIPARSGSTRVVNKNIIDIAGNPLIAWTISSAKRVVDSEVIVSTNCANIADIAKSLGAEIPFLRPDNLSKDNSTSLSVILHTLRTYIEKNRPIPDFLAFRPPTCPFVSTETISTMYKKLQSSEQFNSIVTVTDAELHPFRTVQIDENQKLRNDVVKINNQDINDFERTQDFPQVLEGSPACRMTRTSYFLNLLKENNGHLELQGKTYDNNSSMGSKINKKESFDIDDQEDLIMAREIAEDLIL